MRNVMDAVFWLPCTGAQWAALSKNLPFKSTVYDYFAEWQVDGTFDRILHALVQEDREDGNHLMRIRRPSYHLPSSHPGTVARSCGTCTILAPGNRTKVPSSVSQAAATDPAAMACTRPSTSRSTT